jgi:sugar/nucleoside kinase (ribokinase family)
MLDTLPHCTPSDEELPATTTGGGDACAAAFLTTREQHSREGELLTKWSHAVRQLVAPHGGGAAWLGVWTHARQPCTHL